MLGTIERKRITIICFILANLTLSSFLIFIDSNSMITWEYETTVGPATMFMQSESELPSNAELLGIEGITRVAKVTKSWCSLVIFPPDQNASDLNLADYALAQGGANDPNINLTVAAVAMDTDLFETFPTIFNLTEGRWPTNNRECAVSQWLMSFYGVDIGAIVTYESGFVREYHFLRVVGVFDHPEDDNRNYAYYNIGDIVVMPEFVSERERMYYAYLKMDELQLSPLHAQATILSLVETEEKIRSLDPKYALFHHTSFTLDNMQARGIRRYLDQISSIRVEQSIRTQNALILGIIVYAMGVIFNVSEQERENHLLFARGASRRQIDLAIVRELVSLSLIGMVIAIVGGSIISRLAFLTKGFFVFDYGESLYMPFLVTIESALIMIVFSVLTPLAIFGIERFVTRGKKEEFAETRRLAKLVRVIQKARWDAVVVIVSVAFLFVLWEYGSNSARSPVFSVIGNTVPLMLMVGLASIFAKGSWRFSFCLSKLLHRFRPNGNSWIGCRGITRDRRATSITILMFALIASYLWSGAILNTTIPNTALAHARFALSGDIAFRIDSNANDGVHALESRLALLPGIEATCIIKVYSYSLSSSLQDSLDFTQVDPEKIALVAYDQAGIPLAESRLEEALRLLSENPAGCIVTSDIAEAYGVQEGDVLRAFSSNGTDIEMIPFNILQIVEALPDTLVNNYGYAPPQKSGAEIKVGQGKIWISNQHEEGADSNADLNGIFICARTSNQSLAGSAMKTILQEDTDESIKGFANAYEYALSIGEMPEWVLNNSIDTMLVVSMILALPGAYLVYVNQSREKIASKELALRVYGKTDRELFQIRQSEMITLFLYGIILLLLCIPIYIQNLLVMYTSQSPISYEAFPLPILLVVPGKPFALLLLLLFASNTLINYFQRNQSKKLERNLLRRYILEIDYFGRES